MSQGLGHSKSRRGYSRLQPDNSTENSEPMAPSTAKKLAGASKESKPHPLLKLLGAKNQKKAMASPEFLRYIEYMKEAS